MTWQLRYTDTARKQLGKMDASARNMILLWMSRNIDGCENPRLHGKALVGNLKGSWRYRIGGYRVLCEIRDSELVVLAFEMAHKSEVYEKKARQRKGRR